MFGYAGTGKSTITRHAIDELGLATTSRTAMAGGVLYAAFTGKAALVMTRKGTPASTIHCLIYRVSEATPEEIEKVKQEAAEIQATAGDACAPAERLFAGVAAALASNSGSTTSTSRASCSTSSRWCATPTLLVLDEVSMVGDEMARDLLAFGKPILVLGDPGQLPPIKGEGAFTDVAARRDADRDPPPGRRERHHPARHAWRGRASRSPTASTTSSSGRCGAPTSRPSSCCAAAR